MSLIWSYFGMLKSAPHFVGSVHIACLLLRARSAFLNSKTMHIVKDFLHFGSVTVVGYSATVYSVFRAK